MRIVNITAGECLNGILTKLHTGAFVPFNENMAVGACAAPPFSDRFIQERAQAHSVLEEEYTGKLKGFLDVLENIQKYDQIVLWFGVDEVCVKNRACAIEALRARGYNKEVILNICDELTGEILRREEV